MIFELKAGAKLDLITKSEVEDAIAEGLRSWIKEVGRGIKIQPFAGQGAVNAGQYVIGGAQPGNRKDTLGPAQGMIWAVTYIAVSGTALAAADTVTVWRSEATPTKLVAPIGTDRFKDWDVPGFVLRGGETVAITGPATGAGTDVTLSGQAIELPEQLLWQLLGA